MTREELIEKMATELHQFYKSQSSGWDIKWEGMHKDLQLSFKKEAEYMLSAIKESGFSIVPNEPTDEMITAGIATSLSPTNMIGARLPKNIYKDMVEEGAL